MTDNRRKINIEVAALYVCALAMDLILRDTERRMESENEGWKQEKKQAFKRYLQHVSNACLAHDKVFQDVIDAEEKNNFQNFQVWQEEANEFARLILLFADKNTNLDAVNKIFSVIREQSGEGIVDEELLSNFYLKKLK